MVFGRKRRISDKCRRFEAVQLSCEEVEHVTFDQYLADVRKTPARYHETGVAHLLAV
jgi:hypothetical protein